MERRRGVELKAGGSAEDRRYCTKGVGMETETEAQVVEAAMREFFQRVRVRGEAIDQGDGFAVGGAAVDDDPPEVRKARVAERRRWAMARAVDVLGARDKALRWLRSPNRALDGRKPNALVATDEGFKRVDEVLGRIEYGIYS